MLVNKWDLRPADMNAVKFEKELRYQIKFLPFATVLFVSAETGESGRKAIFTRNLLGVAVK